MTALKVVKADFFSYILFANYKSDISILFPNLDN